jgi:hypothetical protein
MLPKSRLEPKLVEGHQPETEQDDQQPKNQVLLQSAVMFRRHVFTRASGAGCRTHRVRDA